MGETLMLLFQIEETCPRCARPVRLASIDRHPVRTDRALHNFECERCGPVRTREISLSEEARA
jgi:hypothetical protein